MNTLIWMSIISAFSLMAGRSDGCSYGQSTGKIGCITPLYRQLEITTIDTLSFVKRQKGGYCLYDKLISIDKHLRRSHKQTGVEISFQLVPTTAIEQTGRGKAATRKPIAAEDLVDVLTDEKPADTAVDILSGANAIWKTMTVTCSKRSFRRFLYHIITKRQLPPPLVDRCGGEFKKDPDSVVLSKVVSTIKELATSSDSQFTCAKRARI